MGPLPRARRVAVVFPYFVEDGGVRRNLERSAVSVADHTGSVHSGRTAAIALCRPHVCEVPPSSFDFVVRGDLSVLYNDDGFLKPFQVFWTASYNREYLTELTFLDRPRN